LAVLFNLHSFYPFLAANAFGPISKVRQLSLIDLFKMQSNLEVIELAELPMPD
jgi:hypothetical protein